MSARRPFVAGVAAAVFFHAAFAVAQQPAPPPPPPAPAQPAGAGALSAEDTEAAPAANQKTAASELPFFRGGEKLVKPVAVRPRDGGFVPAVGFRLEQLIIPETRPDSSVGTMFDVDLFLGGKYIGFVGGYSNLAGAPGFSLGLTMLRFGRGLRVIDSDGWVGSLLGPTVDVRFRAWAPSVGDPIPSASVGSDFFGFRIAKCLGGPTFHIAAHLPSVNAGMIFIDDNAFRDDDEPLGYVSIGGALDVGLVF